MLHLVSRINYLYFFVNLMLLPAVPLFPTHLLLHPPLLFILIYSPLCSSITPSLVHSLLSKILLPLVSLLPPGLPSWTIARIVSCELLVF